VASFCLFLLVGLPSLSFAQDTNTASSASDVDAYLNKSLDTSPEGDTDEELGAFQGNFSNDDSSSGVAWFFVKIAVGLGIVTGGIWLVSKLLEKSGMTGTDSDVMGVRSTLPLGQNQYLQIVQVGDQYFMLGVTDNNISMLDELTDTDTIRALHQEKDPDERNTSGGFGDVIQNVIGTDDHSFNQKDTEDYLDELHQKINRMSEEGERT
jgi:flagellar protein FliO/FliZ